MGCRVVSTFEPIPQDPDDEYPLPGDRIGKYIAIGILAFFTLFLAVHLVVAIRTGALTDVETPPAAYCESNPTSTHCQ